jgi:hypothetical protein
MNEPNKLERCITIVIKGQTGTNTQAYWTRPLVSKKLNITPGQYSQDFIFFVINE